MLTLRRRQRARPGDAPRAGSIPRLAQGIPRVSRPPSRQFVRRAQHTAAARRDARGVAARPCYRTYTLLRRKVNRQRRNPHMLKLTHKARALLWSPPPFAFRSLRHRHRGQQTGGGGGAEQLAASGAGSKVGGGWGMRPRSQPCAIGLGMRCSRSSSPRTCPRASSSMRNARCRRSGFRARHATSSNTTSRRSRIPSWRRARDSSNP